MTRKDYEHVARAMRDAKDECTQLYATSPHAFAALRLACIALADQLRRDNPRFDKRRFYDACDQEAIST